MISYPNAKINIGLNILQKRGDGYHDIHSVFYPVDLKDILEIVEHKNGSKPEFSSSGLIIPGNLDENLCLKAYQLLKNEFKIPPVKIHLHKAIPMGAGLGGGSADAAFTLKMLNQMFELNLNTAQLQNYAARLGSDCAFFIENKPAFASGRGEILELIDLDLSAYKIVVEIPNIHVSTQQAYAGVLPKTPKESLKNLIQLPIHEWKEHIKNDFEDSVFQLFPEIKKLKHQFYKKEQFMPL
jgi:4-diphosphocytidyl-2-C-methyl-D-erythritol kinase